MATLNCGCFGKSNYNYVSDLRTSRVWVVCLVAQDGPRNIFKNGPKTVQKGAKTGQNGNCQTKIFASISVVFQTAFQNSPNRGAVCLFGHLACPW